MAPELQVADNRSPERYCPHANGAVQCGMGERLMGKTITRWSMKLDRELIALSKTRTLEAIAAKVQRRPESVLKRAARLGLTIEQK
jgi:hypothetical protein